MGRFYCLNTDTAPGRHAGGRDLGPAVHEGPPPLRFRPAVAAGEGSHGGVRAVLVGLLGGAAVDGHRGRGSGGGDRRSVAGCRPISGRRCSSGKSLLGSLRGNIIGPNDSDLPTWRRKWAVDVTYLVSFCISFVSVDYFLR